MMIFEKVKFNTGNERVRQIRLFNYLIMEYYIKLNELKPKKHYVLFPLLYKNVKKMGKFAKPVFYLKFNSSNSYAFICLQQWLDVVDNMGGDFYIICDKPELVSQIYSKIKFHNREVKIIKSFDWLSRLAKNLVHPKWVNAAVAHMTTFYHSKRLNLKSYWNIDADDTMFCFSVEKIVELLNKAEQYANNNSINCFSLDMWRSRSGNEHWSFGITYTQNNIDYISLFEEFTKIDWQKDFAFYNTAMNIDWFFNYLTRYRGVKTYSFYPENAYFIHWGDFLLNVIASSICYWCGGNVFFPILLDVSKNSSVGVVPVAKDTFKFDINLPLEDGENYLNNELFNFDTNIKK